MTTELQSPTRSRVRSLLEGSIICLCTLAFLFIGLFYCVSQITGKTSGTSDFVVYWATGHQFARGANPYDTNALRGLEHVAGFYSGHPVLYMRNPPWALPVTLPLAFLNARVASVVWSMLLLASLAISIRLIWIIHGRQKSLVSLLGYSFAPALLCLLMGQTSIFMLLGLVLFLYLHDTHPFVAGFSLWLCLLKPHLFLPFGVVLILWIVVSRKYKIFAGVVSALGSSLAVTYFLDPRAWAHYLDMVRSSGMDEDFIPCLSFMLRHWINPLWVWIEFIPAAIGCLWAIAYFWPRRSSWEWLRDGSLVMLVSIMVAPYAWLFDQALAIPALLSGAYLTRSRNSIFVLALASALIDVAFFADPWAQATLYLWTLWTAPAWVLWYLAARKATLLDADDLATT